MKILTKNEALNKAAAYCSASEHCISEVMDKLAGWGVGKDSAEEIIKKLVSEKFISEERFACSYARDKMRFAGWGRIKISSMLRAKGISKDVISEAVYSLAENEYEDMLAKILNSKRKYLKSGNEYEKKCKLFRFAVSRGFESDVIKKYIDGLDEDFYAEE